MKSLETLAPYFRPEWEDFFGLSPEDEEKLEKHFGVPVPTAYRDFARRFGHSESSLVFALGPSRPDILRHPCKVKLSRVIGSPTTARLVEWYSQYIEGTAKGRYPTSNIPTILDICFGTFPLTTIPIAEGWPDLDIKVDYVLLGMKGFDRGKVFCLAETMDDEITPRYLGPLPRAENYPHVWRLADSFEEFLKLLVPLWSFWPKPGSS